MAARFTGAVRCRGRRNNSPFATVEAFEETTVSFRRRIRYTRPLSVREFDPNVRRPKMRIAVLSTVLTGFLLGRWSGQPTVAQTASPECSHSDLFGKSDY